MSTSTKLVVCAGLLFLLGAPARSYGHTILTDPPPRDGRDDHKDFNGGAPCGAPRTSTAKVYKSGETLDVKWDEDVNHPGCFLIDLSVADDKDFVQLGGPVKHNGALPNPANGMPRRYAATVTLPPGVSCDKCTLRVRQLMLENDNVACPPSPIPVNVTYYSCGDVQIMASPDMAKQADLSVPPPPADMGHPVKQADLSSPPPPTPGGCQVGGVAGAHAGGPFWSGLLGLFAAGLLLRRRVRRSS